MLRKEITESIKRFLECSLIFIAIPVAFLLDRLIIKSGLEFKDLFLVFFIAAVFIYTVYSGLTLLQAEKKDRALEYLLSMPISRSKILVMKIFSRLLILLLLMFILNFVMDFQSFMGVATYLIVLFIASVSLSIAVDSILLGIIGASIMFEVFMISYKFVRFFFSKIGVEGSNDLLAVLSMFFAALLLLVPFFVSFWLTFKKLDLRPIKLQLQPYYYIAFPALVIILLFIILNYNNYKLWLLNQ